MASKNPGSMISIHAPTKGATLIKKIYPIIQQFQSTLPRRERHPQGRNFLSSFFTFQSTLPRRERRLVEAYCLEMKKFQSTLPRRERPYNVIAPHLPTKYFNPRSHEGSDAVGAVPSMLRKISIHAPTKGATDSARDKFTAEQFQSTLPRRERHRPAHHGNPKLIFQSTLPRRERP